MENQGLTRSDCWLNRVYQRRSFQCRVPRETPSGVSNGKLLTSWYLTGHHRLDLFLKRLGRHPTLQRSTLLQAFFESSEWVMLPLLLELTPTISRQSTCINKWHILLVKKGPLLYLIISQILCWMRSHACANPTIASYKWGITLRSLRMVFKVWIGYGVAFKLADKACIYKRVVTSNTDRKR